MIFEIYCCWWRSPSYLSDASERGCFLGDGGLSFKSIWWFVHVCVWCVCACTHAHMHVHTQTCTHAHVKVREQHWVSVFTFCPIYYGRLSDPGDFRDLLSPLHPHYRSPGIRDSYYCLWLSHGFWGFKLLSLCLHRKWFFC